MGLDVSSSVLVAACEPWAFTQRYPLETREFCKAAERRGLRFDENDLRELWRVGALVPFVEVRDKPLHQGMTPSTPEPAFPGGRLHELQVARNTGRLADPMKLGYRPQLRWHRPASARYRPAWWNGLLYSEWQVLDLETIGRLLRQGSVRRRSGTHRWRCRELDAFEAERARERRDLTALLVALEARYFPTIEARWLHLVVRDEEVWEVFAEQFDPLGVLNRLQRSPEDLLRLADRLLLNAESIDPFGRDWAQLVRRAPRRSWQDLSGTALAAIDRRMAAEVLLRCYEDLVVRGEATPLADRRDIFHSETARISYRSGSLDGSLASLGLSPHPGVVVVVEGETEEYFTPRVRDQVQIPQGAEVMQSVVLRGVNRDLTKLAAFASAPLIEEAAGGNGWLLVKPPTQLAVVIDPDDPYDTPEKVEQQRQKIVDEIVSVVRAQGVDPARDEIDTLVTVTTWAESCFEFAHFDDDELADALRRLHPDCGRLSKEQLVLALGFQRQHHRDIKVVWKKWSKPQPRKTLLAAALWPVMRCKLDLVAKDSTAPWPPIASALVDAYVRAGARPRGRFLLHGSRIEGR